MDNLEQKAKSFSNTFGNQSSKLMREVEYDTGRYVGFIAGYKEHEKELKESLYIVGQVTDYNEKKWHFQGVFSNEQKAIKACITQDFFLAKVDLDIELPIEEIEYKYAYYPLRQN